MVRWPPLLILLVALLAAGAVALWQQARRRRVAPGKRAPRLRHPVVLAHGAFGFDEIAVAGRRHRYFRNIADGLAQLGTTFHHPRVPGAGSIAARAQKLVELVRGLPGDRINVIAHSMGGLDARYAIAHLGLADRVASLVTIGTPHQGTPVAALPISRGIARVLRVEALTDLTPAALERFNREVPDANGVAYCSVVASSDRAHTHPLLWPTHAYLSANGGANDGLVPASSQRWGTVLREVEADHWAQVGWSRHFDAVALYEQILRALDALGF